MPYPGWDLLTSFTPEQQLALQQFAAYLQGYLSQQHKDSGVHGAITADSLSVAGASTALASTTYQLLSSTAVTLPIVAGTFTPSGGSAARPGLSLGGKFWLTLAQENAPGLGTGYELQLWDAQNDTSHPALRLVKDNSTAIWTLTTGASTTHGINIGSTASSIERVQTLAVANIDMIGSLTVSGNKAGEWSTPTFAAGDYTASGAMTWTVAAGNVATSRYTVVKKMLTWVLSLDNTTVGGVVSTDLQIKIPGGFSSNAIAVAGFLRVSDNGSAGESGIAIVAAGTNLLIRRSTTVTPPNWTASAANTLVQGTVCFEIQ